MMKILPRGAVVFLVGAALLSVPRPAGAQAEPDGPTSSTEGPTRVAGAMTAQGYLDSQRGTTPRLMPGFLAFQEDFTRDFGALGPSIGDRVDDLLGLKARLDLRWGDAALYQWIERGLALYARMQASTRLERKGFDFKVQTNDMTEGKLGVQMSRPLGTGSAE